MSEKTFDLLLEDRAQAYKRIEQLEQLCRVLYRAAEEFDCSADSHPNWMHWNGKAWGGDGSIFDRMQALGLFDMDNTDNMDVSKSEDYCPNCGAKVVE